MIIGGGAAGIMAAISASNLGHNVSIYEKNEKLGKKLYITGKGRCNVTNATDMKEIMKCIVSNPKFLYSSFKAYTNEDIMQLIEKAGCKLKVERGNRVFPASDKSSDILKAFQTILSKMGVKVYLYTEVEDLIIQDGVCKGICVKKENIFADAVIIATGGLSYPATGSTGDGYRFAQKGGHHITNLYPSLVPLICKEEACKQLQGLALERVNICILDGKKKIYQGFGEMLFTHFGVSGPALLSASAYISKLLKQGKELILEIDLKPALNKEELDARVLRDFKEYKNKTLKNALVKLFPSKLISEVIRQAKLDENQPIHIMTREERFQLVSITKALQYHIIGVRGFKEAIITQGGIDVKEVNPKTMESKKVQNLYFAGEVLDLDAVTGGYNLQIAWSTGWSAGAGIKFLGNIVEK